MARYKLKLTKLKFISPVDTPAQETATALLLKRAGTSSAVARVAKVDDELGLVFCWAFTSKAAGAEYYDLHGDAIDSDFVSVCAEFMAGARAVDEMHDGKATGQVVFGMPLTAEIAKAFGVETDTEGFMVAIKPAPDAFLKFKSGEYTGVSIEGLGIREAVEKAVWTTAYVNDLPDSAFLYIEGGGEKDDEGKTRPRTLRHFPYKDASGAVDLPHLRNAISRIPQMKGLPAATRDRLQSRARSMLESKTKKRAALTSAAAGHTHLLHGIDDMTCGNTDGALLPGAGEYGRYHAHPWIRNEDGTITIGEQEGHTHALGAPGIAEAAEIEPELEEEIVEMRNSTTAQSARNVAGDTKEPTPMDLATLKKHLSLALALPEAQRAHAATLDEIELGAFLAKSAGDRETIVKAAHDADPVLYTRPDGTAIRKSQGQMLADIAKQADQAMALAAAEVTKREQVELLKRADVELSHFAKTAGTRAAVLKAIDGIADETTRKDALEMLAGANAALKELGKPQGANPEQSAEGTSKQAALRTAVEAIAKAKGIAYPLALIEALKTDPAIRDLYEQADAERN